MAGHRRVVGGAAVYMLGQRETSRRRASA